MRIRILLEHTEINQKTGHDAFYFVIVHFYGSRQADTSLKIDFSAYPAVQAILEKLVLPITPEHLLPAIFNQFLSTLRMVVPDLEKHYFKSGQLDNSGHYSHTLDQAYHKVSQPIEGELALAPANLFSLKLPAVSIDFEKLNEKCPVYRFHRFSYFDAHVLINRTNYDKVKVFLCSGAEDEKAYIHCYFKGNRIKRCKLLRGAGFDKELARYCFEFLKEKLQSRYQFI